jgi:hypothetical protein
MKVGRLKEWRLRSNRLVDQLKKGCREKKEKEITTSQMIFHV